MSNIETVEGILIALDKSITKRDKGYQIIESQYGKSNGHILSSDYYEYKRRKDSVTNRFNEEAIQLQNSLNSLCKKIRNRQSVLCELSEDKLNRKFFIPRQIALGKIRVQYENLDIYVPRMINFPFERSMYICNDKQINLIHKLFLRLMYALPVSKIEFFVFDPFGLGQAVRVFNSLFFVESVFPTKKIMSSSNDLKKELKKALEYAEHLIQEVFSSECINWEEYNRLMYSQGKYNNIRPYKVFTFIDVPDGMDTECFDMFRKILIHSKDCGFLVVFSFNEVVLEAEDSKLNTMALELKKCIERSQQLHEIVNYSKCNLPVDNLEITNIGEKLPEGSAFQELVDIYKRNVEETANNKLSFDDLSYSRGLYGRISVLELSIPIGYNETNGNKVELLIGDETPHYLIGGTTGSGKSNLLHNFIISACCRYSPEDLQVYLLDFKEGVEFSIYANPTLPHARLVATEADTEYGISVLGHLVREKERRYSLFKNKGCKDIKACRQNNPEILMPRILVIVDEFQVLFGNSEKTKTIEILEMLAKQGRGCGIHLIMATQSLKGIDFGTLGSQFGGRIALRCSSEDSKQLLGSITSNNEAAAELKIPYAILNTSQGSLSGNIKFAVPYADASEIRDKIKILLSQRYNGGRIGETKIFDGQKMPSFPQEREFESHDKMELKIGEVMDFDSDPFEIKLLEKEENNVLICGSDETMKNGLLKSILLSALHNGNIQEIIYIGNRGIRESVLEHDNQIKCLSDLNEFVEKYADRMFEKRRIIIMDNCNLVKEVKYPTGYVSTLPENVQKLVNYINEANLQGDYIVAFYERISSLKNGKLPTESFGHRIGFSLNADEKNKLLDNPVMLSSPMKSNRAFYAENGIIKTWFRPYVEKENE